MFVTLYPLLSQWSGLYHDPPINLRGPKALPHQIARRVLSFEIVSEPSANKVRHQNFGGCLRQLGCGLPWPFGFRLPAIHPVFQPNLRPEAAICSQRAALPAELLGKILPCKIFSADALVAEHKLVYAFKNKRGHKNS